MKPSPGRNAMKSDEEWRRQLTPEQFHVARQHGTERPFSSPLNSEKQPGMFIVRRRAALFVQRQVRFGHRVAKLLGDGQRRHGERK
jgi:peptide methionine sulfoxide reductase MsrB